MSHFTKQYISQLICIIALLISSVFLLFSSLSKDFLLKNNYNSILVVFGWIIIASCGIYLFIIATRIKTISTSQDSVNNIINSGGKSKTYSTKEQQLDIKSLARKISRKIDVHDSPKNWGDQLLGLFSRELEIMSGLFYFRVKPEIFEAVSTYAYPLPGQPYSFGPGDGLTGQTAKNMRVTFYRNIPEDYGKVFSGLGDSKPLYIAMIPFVRNNESIAVLEIAGFRYADDDLEHLFQILAKEINDKLIDIEKSKNKSMEEKSDETDNA